MEFIAPPGGPEYKQVSSISNSSSAELYMDPSSMVGSYSFISIIDRPLLLKFLEIPELFFLS